MSLVLYKTRHGHLYHFDKDNTIGAALLHYGEWAEAEIHLLSHILQPGDIALDIGANVGTHALAFGRLVTPHGKVIAIDAQHNIFQVLSANMLINHMHQVTCLNTLVGAEVGVRYIPGSAADDTRNFGAMSFQGTASSHPPTDALTENTLLPITMLTVDSLAVERCALMKVDVEGMEFDVFQGAKQTIERCRPVIYFEQIGDKNLAEIFDFFKALGYQLFWHVSNPFNAVNFNQHPVNIFGGTCETNILALPSERVELIAQLEATLAPLTIPEYNPPIPTNSIRGWQLPETAYAQLAIPFTHLNQSSLLSNCETVSRSQFENLQQAFTALKEDRTKAQHIMQYQMEQIVDLQSKLKQQQIEALT